MNVLLVPVSFGKMLGLITDLLGELHKDRWKMLCCLNRFTGPCTQLSDLGSEMSRPRVLAVGMLPSMPTIAQCSTIHSLHKQGWHHYSFIWIANVFFYFLFLGLSVYNILGNLAHLETQPNCCSLSVFTTKGLYKAKYIKKVSWKLPFFLWLFQYV